MDKALELKILTDSRKTIDKICIEDYLINSKLLTELIREMPDKPLEMVWRLIALSEIPYSYTLGYTTSLIEKVTYIIKQAIEPK